MSDRDLSDDEIERRIGAYEQQFGREAYGPYWSSGKPRQRIAERVEEPAKATPPRLPAPTVREPMGRGSRSGRISAELQDDRDDMQAGIVGRRRREPPDRDDRPAVPAWFATGLIMTLGIALALVMIYATNIGALHLTPKALVLAHTSAPAPAQSTPPPANAFSAPVSTNTATPAPTSSTCPDTGQWTEAFTADGHAGFAPGAGDVAISSGTKYRKLGQRQGDDVQIELAGCGQVWVKYNLVGEPGPTPVPPRPTAPPLICRDATLNAGVAGTYAGHGCAYTIPDADAAAQADAQRKFAADHPPQVVPTVIPTPTFRLSATGTPSN